MMGLVLALLVAGLLGTGAYLVLQRSPVRLVLGLALLSHGVNLLLFGAGSLKQGLPPIILDKEAFAGNISRFVDPLPQALILTAIVISFGISAFVIALLDRRHTLLRWGDSHGERADDPMALHPSTQQPQTEDDYEWLEDLLRKR
jgi:multicomponent Na+:H+ antiporter subunit C